MDPKPRVALVRSGSRRGGLAQALHLIGDDLRRVVTPDVLIKPNLVSHRRQLPSTHADALSATLDAVLAAGARSVIVAEGASDAPAGFERFGYTRETHGRPVRYFNINADEGRWLPLELAGVDGEPRQARVSSTVAQATCRVSLALAKTHMIVPVTLSMKNMLSSIHPEDRVMMHGYPAGNNGSRGWKRHLVNWLKRDDWAVNGFTRAMGRARNLLNMIRRLDAADGMTRLSDADRRFLRSALAMQSNLVRLNRAVRPHVSVIDGFVGMHREGPRHGTPIALGLAIAGTDPVAVDAVAAAAMGFDPLEVGYLREADRAGLGVARLDGIEILGDDLKSVGRRCVPHSTHAVQRHASSVAASPARDVQQPARGPHRVPGRRAEPQTRG